MLTLTNGCICCGIGGDFIAALASLRDVDDPPEQVVVEASGVADPGQIAIFGDMPGYVRDAVVVVADADSVRSRAEDEATGHAVRAQLRAADLLVVSKTDLVEPARSRTCARGCARSSARRRASSTRRSATCRSTSSSARAPSRGALRARAGPTARARPRPRPPARSRPGASAATRRSAAPALVEAIAAFPDGIVRAKGFLHLREDPASRYLLQLVGRRYSIEPDRPWGDEPPRLAARRHRPAGLRRRRPRSTRRSRGSARRSPPRPPAADDPADRRRERDVVEDLRHERQRADARVAPADDAEVERGDREPAGHRPRDRPAPRQARGEHERPAERQRAVRHERGRQQPRRALLVRQQQRPRRERRLERVDRVEQRVQRRRRRR